MFRFSTAPEENWGFKDQLNPRGSLSHPPSDVSSPLIGHGSPQCDTHHPDGVSLCSVSMHPPGPGTGCGFWTLTIKQFFRSWPAITKKASDTNPLLQRCQTRKWVRPICKHHEHFHTSFRKCAWSPQGSDFAFASVRSVVSSPHMRVRSTCTHSH